MTQPYVRIHVENLEQVEARLMDLGAVKIPRTLGQVVAAGAKVMREGIRSAGQSMTAGQSKVAPGGLIAGVRYKKARGGASVRGMAAAEAVGSEGLDYIVGPFGKNTQHRHLVIDGHEIVGHEPYLTRTGERTRGVPFVKAGAEASQGAALAAIEAAAKAAIEEAERL
jgi:hypothetical protein